MEKIPFESQPEERIESSESDNIERTIERIKTALEESPAVKVMNIFIEEGVVPWTGIRFGEAIKNHPDKKLYDAFTAWAEKVRERKEKDKKSEK